MVVHNVKRKDQNPPERGYCRNSQCQTEGPKSIRDVTGSQYPREGSNTQMIAHIWRAFRVPNPKESTEIGLFVTSEWSIYTIFYELRNQIALARR